MHVDAEQRHLRLEVERLVVDVRLQQLVLSGEHGAHHDEDDGEGEEDQGQGQAVPEDPAPGGVGLAQLA